MLNKLPHLLVHQKEAERDPAQPGKQAHLRPASAQAAPFDGEEHHSDHQRADQAPAPFEGHRADEEQRTEPEFEPAGLAAHAAVDDDPHEEIGEEVQPPAIPGFVEIEMEQRKGEQRPAQQADEVDLALIKAKNVGIAHCPSSNMKLASGIAPVARMLALGINVGLGPDGPAGSNNDFNMFEEMDLAAKLAKVATGDPQAVNARQALDMATIGGARVLGLDGEIGSVEAGKRADLIFVQTDKAHAQPLFHVESQLVYAIKASDVSDVFVNGRQVVRGGVPLTLNHTEVLAKAKAYRQAILRSLP